MCYARVNHSMNTENKPQIVSDTGCFIRREGIAPNEYGVNYAPLNISFFENGDWVSYEDTDLSPEEFYSKMRASEKLPKTSGAITGKLINLYDSAINKDQSTISIHITSKHSAVYNSATLAKSIIQEKYPQIFNKKKPHLYIEVIDSKQISIAGGFLAEQAVSLANEGYPIKDICKIILETIPKTEIFTTLNSFENVVKGGRLPAAIGAIGDKLQIKPFIAIVDGEMKIIKRSLTRTNKNAHKELVKRVENTQGDIIKLAVVHTNDLSGALELQKSLSQLYSGVIDIFEAGPALGVHAGEGGLGIAFQKA